MFKLRSLKWAVLATGIMFQLGLGAGGCGGPIGLAAAGLVGLVLLGGGLGNAT